ncbi:NAD-dependent DNA ligase LigA [Candidatus Pelagibacter sp. HIMB1321]|uniref:NAD-dependent DNA ligase LigA n=1 Tax=Candidatus Pelagibacter sp. HIMB1321 TaxID=1388755 RepID=UPI000A08018A|nr:NAD-dependent DNA ligase LigA [Candidatus Pelagibacter sp. HIMB1321]SMF71353.1 DNA ligase (NAD+) [Candidatus Pelagibacter sp. HIMB1321]
MDKKKILADYNHKISRINELNKSYYQLNKTIVPDFEFDQLKKEILELENQYDFLDHKNSPSKTVGYKPSRNFEKIKHKVPMLSLSNAFSKEDLENFYKKIQNYLELDSSQIIDISAEPKIDGISASLIYKNRQFVTGLSRGDGKEGEDITENLKTIIDIPKNIKDPTFPDEIDIRGEVFIQNNDFKNLSDKFSNPRNAASGSLRQKDSTETKKIPLKFIAYTFGYEKGLKVNSQEEFLDSLKKWGFKTNHLNKTFNNITDLLKNYKHIEEKRNELTFDIDGIVYKVNDFKLQKRLGYVANSPRWAIAHKFSAFKGVSNILDIEIQIGRTGALTPVAKIKPINIGGVIVSNATLHNEDEIIRKDIRVNDTVLVERAGDVIPHIISVDLKKRPGNSKKFVFPKKCPSCGSITIKEFNKTTKKTDAVRRCSSEGYECEKVSIEKIKHFVSKEAFNIDGLGKKIVEKFWQLNLIRYPYDIFKLDYKKIENLDGWGKQSMNNLKYSIDQKKNISFERFIYSLGIRHIGFEGAKLIAKNLKKSKNFLTLLNKKKIEELKNLDGIGETQIKSIKDFFANYTNSQIVKSLFNLIYIEDFNSIDENGVLKGQTFLLTGKLEKMSRAEAKALIEKNSGNVVSNVSKKLDYLIVGEKPTKRKIESAKEFKVKIINQSEWLKMLNLTG